MKANEKDLYFFCEEDQEQEIQRTLDGAVFAWLEAHGLSSGENLPDSIIISQCKKIAEHNVNLRKWLNENEDK